MGAVGAPAASAAIEPAGTARLCEQVRAAAATGSQLGVRGAGTWWPDRSGAVLEAGMLEPSLRIEAGDLVAGVSASCTMMQLTSALREAGAWVALDAPGGGSRTLGSVLATGCPGPLAARFGPPRDQVLGLSFVCGNGTVARSGGRVVKNVAGFDLAKAVVGGHGAYGVIVGAHLRLRALPEGDTTTAGSGTLERVAATAGAMMDSGHMPSALEVVNPAVAGAFGAGDRWVVMSRVMGVLDGVRDEGATAGRWISTGGLDLFWPGASIWERWSAAMAGPPVMLRIGARPAEWPEAAALAERFMGAGVLLSITVPRGTVRAAGSLTAVGLRSLRTAAAARSWPVTLERAPAALLAAGGVWGVLPDGIDRLARNLRATFDPDGVFDVPLWGAV